jgi:hypothetical protein
VKVLFPVLSIEPIGSPFRTKGKTFEKTFPLVCRRAMPTLGDSRKAGQIARPFFIPLDVNIRCFVLLLLTAGSRGDSLVAHPTMREG